MANDFNILTGPSVYDQDDTSRRKPLKNYTVRGLLSFTVIGLFVGLFLTKGDITFLPMVFLAVIASAILGFTLGSLVDIRRQAKVSWLQTEIETSWFRNLKLLEKEQLLDNFWDDWERNCKNTGSMDGQNSPSKDEHKSQDRRLLKLNTV